MPLNKKRERELSSTRKEEFALTDGLFMVQSVIVLGSKSCVEFIYTDTEFVIVDTDEGNVIHNKRCVRMGIYRVAEEPDLVRRRGIMEIVPKKVQLRCNTFMTPQKLGLQDLQSISCRYRHVVNPRGSFGFPTSFLYQITQNSWSIIENELL